MKIIIGCFMAGVAVLICSLTYIQLIKGEYYTEKAVSQQTKDTLIAPKRGSILDRNGEVLAESSTAYNVVIDPSLVAKRKEDAEAISRFLADTLELEYDEVYEKVSKSESAYQVIKKKVDQTTRDTIKQYATDNKVNSITMEEDSLRTYPYGNFASHILGFVGSDNQGLNGIEATYDQELRGTAGRKIGAKKGDNEMPFEYEQYDEAQNGYDIVLTIDEVIQHYLEKYLEEAVDQYQLTGKAMGIVMNVNTGEILAMANKNDYDPNDPFAITDEAVLEEIEALPEDEQNTYRSNYLQQEVWRNTVVSDTYDPGSVFKIITAAMALEEGAATLDSTYYCAGAYSVEGWPKPIQCWYHSGHGSETFADAVRNSCNPAFMQMVQALGAENFYKYQVAFGFQDKTGIDIAGEGTSIIHSESALNVPINLAITSFGQRFKVTPLQMITAISAVANGGTLYTPYVVKEMRDEDGTAVSTKEPEAKRQVISEETAKTLCEVLETVAMPGGTGKNAYIKGFRVAGKTGTTEKLDEEDTSLRLVSFGGFAPADDPEIACLIILDEPHTGNVGGGAMAAPVFRKVLEDTLNYLGVEAKYTEEESGTAEQTTPNLVDKTVEDAIKELQSSNLKYKVVGSGTKVVDQIPKPKAKMPAGSTVYLYTEGNAPEETVTVPDLTGLSSQVANQRLAALGLNIRVSGAADANATVVSQSPAAGTQVAKATVITVDMVSLGGTGE